MFFMCKLTLNTLNAAQVLDVSNLVSRLAAGQSLSGAINQMVTPSLIDTDLITYTGFVSNGWTLDGNMELSSVCLDGVKQKRVKFGLGTTTFTASIGDGVRTINTNGVVATYTKSLWLVLRVTDTSIMFGTFDATNNTSFDGFIITEYADTGNTNLSADVLPVALIKLNYSGFTGSSSIRIQLTAFSVLRTDNAINPGVGSDMIFGDVVTTGNAVNLQTYGKGDQFDFYGNIKDALIPFGISVPVVTGATGYKASTASITDCCGIYIHQGIGSQTTLYLTPSDIVEVDGEDYLFFRYFAIPMN